MAILGDMRKFYRMIAKNCSALNNPMIDTVHFDVHILRQRYSKNLAIFIFAHVSIRSELNGFETI